MNEPNDQFLIDNSTNEERKTKLADPSKYYIETPTVYEVKLERKLFKCPRYSLLLNGSIQATAKSRTGCIVLNSGTEAHFTDMSQSQAAIERFNYRNEIRSDGNNHTVRYFSDPDSGYLDLHVIFHIGSDLLMMTGLKNMPKEHMFSLNKVMDSSHPCIIYLQNGKTAMTFTQVTKDTFRIENHIKVSNIFTFAIFMSAITGPHSQAS